MIFNLELWSGDRMEHGKVWVNMEINYLFEEIYLFIFVMQFDNMRKLYHFLELMPISPFFGTYVFEHTSPFVFRIVPQPSG